MKTVAIISLGVKVGTWKRELPQGSFLCAFAQPVITRLRPFELTYIKYDWIKYEITRMECVEYISDIVGNIINADDKEDLYIFLKNGNKL